MRFVRDACLPACLPAGRTVLYCTTCRYGSPHCRTGCVRHSFGLRLGFIRDSFGMPAFLPASLHACRQAVGTRTSTVLHTTSIRTSVVPGVRYCRCGDAAAMRRSPQQSLYGRREIGYSTVLSNYRVTSRLRRPPAP